MPAHGPSSSRGRRGRQRGCLRLRSGDRLGPAGQRGCLGFRSGGLRDAHSEARHVGAAAVTLAAVGAGEPVGAVDWLDVAALAAHGGIAVAVVTRSRGG